LPRFIAKPLAHIKKHKMAPFRLTYGKMELIEKNWQLVADKFHGKFRNILSTSPAIIDPINNKIRRFELHIPLAGSNMIFRTSENHHFKVDYKFKHILDFEMQIYPEDFFEKISKLLGMKEVEIGNSDFDNKYIIKSTEPEYTKELLDNTIQSYMVKFNIYSFQLTTDSESNLMIMPYIKEQETQELEGFILFTGYLIKRMTEINDRCI